MAALALVAEGGQGGVRVEAGVGGGGRACVGFRSAFDERTKVRKL